MIVKYKYTRTISLDIYSLFIMDTGNANAKEVSNSSVLARKKNGAKKGETDKISEKMEGGIIVKRVDGRKVEPK